MFLHGGNDSIVPSIEVDRVVAKLRSQKGIVIDHELVPDANHFWVDQLHEVQNRIGAYLDKRLTVEA